MPGEPTDCEGESEEPPDDLDGRPQRHEHDQAGRVQPEYDDHAGDVACARQDPKKVVRGKPALPLKDGDAETQSEDSGRYEKGDSGRHLDVRRVGRHDGGKRSRLKDKHHSHLEHSNPGQARHDAAGLSRIAGDVVRHRRGKPERPGKRKGTRDDDQQREIAAVFGAETSGGDDAADYGDQLQAAGGG